MPAPSITFSTDVRPLSQAELDQQLAVATLRGNLNGMGLLVTAGANPNASRDGKPLLFLAATDMPQAVDELLRLGADVNLPDENGSTLLMAQVGRSVPGDDGAVARVQAWLDRGADPARPENRFLLHSVGFNGRLDVLNLLLDHGASALVQNGKGQWPEDIARSRNGQAAVAERLQSARVEQEQRALQDAMDEALPPSRSGFDRSRARL